MSEPRVLRVLQFKDGLSFVVDRILNGKKHPVIVAIFGPRDSGKTKLREVARDRLHREFGKSGLSVMCGTDLYDYPQYHSGLDFLLVEDVGDYVSTDAYVLRYFTKFPDLSVYITQKFSMESLEPQARALIQEGVYDLVIENPQATKK